MVLHIPLYIRLFGPAPVFDMIKYEKQHGIVKSMFDMSSKRFGSTNDEMMNRVVLQKALNGAMPVQVSMERSHEGQGRYILDDVFYNTEGNIMFSTTRGERNREKIIFHNGVFQLPENPAFINPIADDVTFNNTMQAYMVYLKDHDVQIEGM